MAEKNYADSIHYQQDLILNATARQIDGRRFFFLEVLLAIGLACRLPGARMS
jgi:hypothetical protein